MVYGGVPVSRVIKIGKRWVFSLCFLQADLLESFNFLITRLFLLRLRRTIFKSQIQKRRRLPYPTLRLRPGRDIVLKSGHPWLFSGAVHSVEAGIRPGEIVRAVSGDGQVLGLGFYHPKGDIAFRLLTQDGGREIDRLFWRERIESAKGIRDVCIPPDTDAFRLINAEGDRLPGLIADRYAGILVVSFQTLGIENHRDTILGILGEICGPGAVYERSESRSRRQEGLRDRTGWLSGTPPRETIRIRENGLNFEVDVVGGQKTGFFLDQRPNRQLVRTLSQGKTVLNCFSYTGGFSVYAAAGGAVRVVSVETSKNANTVAAVNLEQNGYSDGDHPIVAGAARDARKQVRILQALGPGPDHPVLLAHPEGGYLKGLLLSVGDA